jgi:hypothetical protein
MSPIAAISVAAVVTSIPGIVISRVAVNVQADTASDHRLLCSRVRLPV